MADKVVQIIKEDKLHALLKLPQVKLDIGCGLHFMQPVNQWVHIDWNDHEEVEIVCNFASIPLDRGVADIIYLGDVIEHIRVYEQAHVLTHWNRLLTMGGMLAGATPNGPYDVANYAAGNIPFDGDNSLVTPRLFGWQDRPGEIHYTIFSRRSLKALLEKYGFENVKFDDTKHPKGPSPTGPNEKGFHPKGEDGVFEPWWLHFTAKKTKEL